MSYFETGSEEAEALVAVRAREGASPSASGATTQTIKGGNPTEVEAATDGFGLAIPAWGDVEQEHAAIVQFDGNIPREWAEGFARLDPDNPPGDVPPQRWLRFVDDIGLFLDSPFCASAAALG